MYRKISASFCISSNRSALFFQEPLVLPYPTSGTNNLETATSQFQWLPSSALQEHNIQHRNWHSFCDCLRRLPHHFDWRICRSLDVSSNHQKDRYLLLLGRLCRVRCCWCPQHQTLREWLEHPAERLWFGQGFHCHHQWCHIFGGFTSDMAWWLVKRKQNCGLIERNVAF